MEEKLVRLVISKYFASKGIKVIASRGSGPDLLIDGKAVEVKGSRYDFDRMLKQLVDYAYKYSDIALALPFDGLTLEEAQQLADLAGLIEEARNIRLKVYVAAPDPSRENLFYVREFKEASLVLACMGRPSLSKLGLDLRDPDSTIHQAVENLIKYNPTSELRSHICTDYTREVSKVQI